MSKVSVIIPAYNQGQYVAQAIDSVLAQSYDYFDIIVIDDGSTDNTDDTVKSFSDKRIRYLFQENSGLSAARNSGIRHSTGRYLSYLDSDDLFLPEKLKLQVSLLEQEPGLGFVAGQAIPIDEQGNRIGKIFDKAIPEDGRELLLGNPLHVGSVMVRRSCQERVGFFDEKLRSYEDWDMWLRFLSMGCRAGWVPKPVSLYRFHAEQMVRNSYQMTTATLAVLDKTFKDSTIPEEWHEVKDLAYSNAYLRSTVQAYHSHDFASAKSYLMKAVILNPTLVANDASLLANRFAAFADSPKHRNPLTFLELIYNNLPAELKVLKQRRKLDLSRAALQQAYEAYYRSDMTIAKYSILRAIRFQPSVLKNKGVLSILRQTILSGAETF